MLKKKKKKRKVIYVFGSNLAGIHGKGSAKVAKEQYGAKIGRGKGRTGNAYAIPTKDKNLRTLSLTRINYYVNQFIFYAYKHPRLKFKVVPIGCGLAGYQVKDIAPMFKSVLFDTSRLNIDLPKEFIDYLYQERNK